ncbi:MAG: YfcE family phosphodiesterase [Clostridia bacterium]|nr:YfcE family phosphodiesterase [Clostridia bacterium]
MTKYLVLSDIHNADLQLEMILEKNRDSQCVVICGDFEMETFDAEEIIRRYLGKSTDIRMVKGNCDAYYLSFAKIPNEISFSISDKHRAFVTHGHLFRANTEIMSYAAEEKNCDVVLFGHTHIQTDRTEYGLRFLNPGSVRNGNYLTITTDYSGEMQVELFG